MLYFCLFDATSRRLSAFNAMGTSGINLLEQGNMARLKINAGTDKDLCIKRPFPLALNEVLMSYLQLLFCFAASLFPDDFFSFKPKVLKIPSEQHYIPPTPLPPNPFPSISHWASCGDSGRSLGDLHRMASASRL